MSNIVGRAWPRLLSPGPLISPAVRSPWSLYLLHGHSNMHPLAFSRFLLISKIAPISKDTISKFVHHDGHCDYVHDKTSSYTILIYSGFKFLRNLDWINLDCGEKRTQLTSLGISPLLYPDIKTVDKSFQESQDKLQ